jgi:hypothetical protein
MFDKSDDGNVVTVKGIYNGQEKPVRFASSGNCVSHGPYLLGWELNDSSVMLQALFDLSQSAHISTIPENSFVAYVQVMDFSVNALPIDARKYDFSIDGIWQKPEENKAKKRRRGDLWDIIKKNKWIDAPPELQSTGFGILPVYSMWTAAEKSTFEIENATKYPQKYASVVALPAAGQTGDYCFPFLNKFIEIGLGTFHSNYNVSDYLNSIEVDTLEKGGDLLTSYKIPENADRKRLRKNIPRVKAGPAITEVVNTLREKFNMRYHRRGNMIWGAGNRIYFELYFFNEEKTNTHKFKVLIYPKPDAMVEDNTPFAAGLVATQYKPDGDLTNINLNDLEDKFDIQSSYNLIPDISGDKISDEDKEGFLNAYRAIEEVKSQVGGEKRDMKIETVLERMVFSTGNRIYVKFKFLAVENGNDFTDQREILIYPSTDEEGRETFSWSYLDEDLLQDEIDYNLINGPVNVAYVRSKIQEAADQNLPSAKRPRPARPGGAVSNGGDGMDVDETDITLTYGVNTVAFQYWHDGHHINMKLLEGFSWSASRKLYNDRNADPLQINIDDQLLSPSDHVRCAAIYKETKEMIDLHMKNKEENIIWH